ncbi:hypothetical protein Y013_25080 (plasmid) [Rhodococcus pyridinivorans SB3094]|uniref:Rieske domain-containing protein n=1 Tax=Rhodococcus pyridinivorans SB3094 TaxID=1435356 RepID=V9XRL0_9NOCA|nr:hypothetical protein Y013_25080 [Rhodococcus pyridinivorans SB3094]
MLAPPIPPEGEGGFTQTWYPICLSADVPEGKIVGRDFLDGRVIVFRGPDGAARVLSAYCPHLGADLSVGDLDDGTVRCAFHHWRFDVAGTCVGTGCGDTPPPRAKLFTFPVQERYGIVWAFNGEAPIFELPDFPFPDDGLAIRTLELDEIFPVDPWTFCANTPDVQHIKALHGISFENGDPDPDEFTWTDHSFRYALEGRLPSGDPIAYDLGITGTNIFYQSGSVNGRWFGFIMPFGIPYPGAMTSFMILAARGGDGDDTEAFLDSVQALEEAIVADDRPVLHTIHFRPGTTTASDKALNRFLQYVRDFPRAHPSAEFIN